MEFAPGQEWSLLLIWSTEDLILTPSLQFSLPSSKSTAENFLSSYPHLQGGSQQKSAEGSSQLFLNGFIKHLLHNLASWATVIDLLVQMATSCANHRSKPTSSTATG
jgi:hypothetical protein